MAEGRVVLALALLATWLGAAVLFACVVAPAAFAVLPSRELAGALVGRVLPVLFLSGIALGVAAGALTVRGRGRAPSVAAFAVAVACAVAQFGVGPRIGRLRAEIGPSLAALDASDPRRAAFGRLHALSVAWLGVGVLASAAALGLLWLAMRQRSVP